MHVALVEPLTVAWHAVTRSPVATARTALVVGGGPIGLAVVQALQAHGVKCIVVAEVSAQRRRFAETLGATDVLDPRTEDIEARVRLLSNDAGVDIAFECSGVQAGFDSALKGVRARGTVTVVSLWEEKPVIDAWELVGSEKHVIGSAIFDGDDFEAVIDAIASGMWALTNACFLFHVSFGSIADIAGTGKLKPQSMITSKIRMEDIVEKGFEALINERDKHVKILIDVSA